MKFNRFVTVSVFALTIALISTVAPAGAEVIPGDVITPDNASKVEGLVSPGNFILVKQGMIMKIVPTGHLDWPPPYKEATERYSPQVSLSSDGELKSYVAGLPFPLVDANDPDAATKIMWNFAFRPVATDDLDERGIEAVSHRAGSPNEVEHFTFGHLGFYNSVGRTEVAPMPMDPDVMKTGIASHSGAFPILEPAEMRGAGIVSQRSARPGIEDAVWEYSAGTRRLRRLPATELSDTFGVAADGSSGQMSGGVGGATTYASTWDPSSAFGFSARIQDYSYRLLGERSMLASVEAENSPAQALRQRWRPYGLPGELGNAASLCDRSDREASLSDRRQRDCSQAHSLRRFRRMVHHRRRSIRPQRTAVENDRGLPCISRPGSAQLHGRDLAVQTHVRNRAG